MKDTGESDFSTKAIDTKQRRWLGWLVPLMALAASLGLAYGAYSLAGYSWNQVVDYRSPYTSMSGADFSGVRPDLSDPIPDATSRRVVMVLIDGLRDDASRTMDSISGLRARGADVRLTAPQPSLSYPTWTTALTGAPPQISGVTTNWFEGRVAVESLFDVAAGSGRRLVISGPKDLDELYGVSQIATDTALIEWADGEYMSDEVVDNAIALDKAAGGGDFVFVLLPDVDNAGHDFGGASKEYAEVVAKVDDDLQRLIDALDDGNTTFVVLPDHGHIDSGGHGGWEPDAVNTFVALAGPGVVSTGASGEDAPHAQLADVAPTVAVLAGIQAPLQGTGTAIDAVLSDTNGSSRDAEFVRAAGVTLSYVRKVLGDDGVREVSSISAPSQLAGMQRAADAKKLVKERDSRLAMIAGAAIAVGVFLIFLGITSWRALVAAVVGTLTYTAAYNALFFGLHHLDWSLSAFNDESMVQAFFNQRMLEAGLAGVAACLVAALVYGALRTRGPRRPGEWLSVGGATVLLVQGALAVQVALFLWRWGAAVTWILPNMREAFKYDLDLIQMTALGAAAVAGPLLVWLVGRFHPKAATVKAEE